MVHSSFTVLRQHAELVYALINDRDFADQLLSDPEVSSDKAVSQQSQVTFADLRNASTALHEILSSQAYSAPVKVNPITARTILNVLNRASEIAQEQGKDPLVYIAKKVQHLGLIGIEDIYLELDPGQTNLTELREVYANVHDAYEKAGVSPERYAANLTQNLLDRAETLGPDGLTNILAKHGIKPKTSDMGFREFDLNSPLGRKRRVESIFDHLAGKLPRDKNQLKNQLQKALSRTFPSEQYEVLVLLSEDPETDLIQTRLGIEKKRRLASIGVDVLNIPAPDAQLIDLRNDSIIRANVLVIPRDPHVLLFESIDWENLRFHFESLWILPRANVDLASRVAPFSQKWDDFMQGKLDVSRVTDDDLNILSDLAQELLRVNQGLNVDPEPFRKVYATASTMLELRAQIGQGKSLSDNPQNVKNIYETNLRNIEEQKKSVDLTATAELVVITLRLPGSIEGKWGSVAKQLAKSGQFGTKDQILGTLQKGDDVAIDRIVDELRWYTSEPDFDTFFKKSLIEYRTSIGAQKGRDERPDSEERRSNTGRK